MLNVTVYLYITLNTLHWTGFEIISESAFVCLFIFKLSCSALHPSLETAEPCVEIQLLLQNGIQTKYVINCTLTCDNIRKKYNNNGTDA